MQRNHCWPTNESSERVARRAAGRRGHEPSECKRPLLDGDRAIPEARISVGLNSNAASLRSSAANEHKGLGHVEIARDAAHHQLLSRGIAAPAMEKIGL